MPAGVPFTKSSNRDGLSGQCLAYGSAREVEYQIGLSHRLGFLSTGGHTELLPVATEAATVLNGLLRALRRQ